MRQEPSNTSWLLHSPVPVIHAQNFCTCTKQIIKPIGGALIDEERILQGQMQQLMLLKKGLGTVRAVSEHGANLTQRYCWQLGQHEGRPSHRPCCEPPLLSLHKFYTVHFSGSPDTVSARKVVSPDVLSSHKALQRSAALSAVEANDITL